MFMSEHVFVPYQKKTIQIPSTVLHYNHEGPV